MTRRRVLSALPALSLAAAAPNENQRQYIWMRKIYLRNSADAQGVKTADFLEKHFKPAIERNGAIATGFLASLIAPDTPFYIVLASFSSLAAIEMAMTKMEGDSPYQKARTSFDQAAGLRYQRFETAVLRGFENFPAIVPPSLDTKKAPRVFELRTYESNSSTGLAEKMKMFNTGEIDIFRKTGLEPVFFGETIFGGKQPNLTYMLCYDDLAARDANWKTFVNHPEWTKLKSTPGWSDAEIVSNISNILLRPLPFSPIR